MFKTKSTAIFLAGTILTTGFAASCGTAGTSSETTTAQNVTDTTAEPVKDAFESLRGIDLGNETVNILCRDDDSAWAYNNEIGISEQTGDIVNDAIYKRNDRVSELLNVTLKTETVDASWANQKQVLELIRSSVMSGDNLYDLIVIPQVYGASLALEGNLHNMLEIPHIDISQPYWNELSIDANTVNDRCYLLSGDIGLSTTTMIFATYFNKRLAEDLNIGNVYDIVRNGEWTCEKVIELSAIAASDVNGNNEFELDVDRYGYAANQTNEFLSAFDIQLTKKENGVPVLDMNTQKLADAVEWSNKFYYESTGVAPLDKSSTSADVTLDMFTGGRLLFYTSYLGRANQLRSMEDDFGVIPVFKWDKAQENYISHLNGAVSGFGIPITCEKTDAVGAVMEALAIDGRETVMPAYYDGALSNKYLRDNESVEMIELMREHIYFGFYLAYGNYFNNLSNLLNNLVKAHDPNYASYIASNGDMFEATLESLIESLSGDK